MPSTGSYPGAQNAAREVLPGTRWTQPVAETARIPAWTYSPVEAKV